MDPERTVESRCVAVMQPYFFPYIGYFQLLYQSDLFVFYDDVNFIKQGWINRNRILINGESKYITIPCKNLSSNRLIKDIKLNLDDPEKEKLVKKIRFAYGNAPYFESVFPIVKRVIYSDVSTVSDLACKSIEETSRYLEVETQFKISSREYCNVDLARSDRLIDICRKEKAGIYLNSIGGVDLYDKTYFASQGIQIEFLEPNVIPYPQFDNDFVPGLSIIDVMMFNSPERIKEMLISIDWLQNDEHISAQNRTF